MPKHRPHKLSRIFTEPAFICWIPFRLTFPPRTSAAARTAGSPFMGLSPCASRNTFLNKAYTGEIGLFATRRPPGCCGGAKQKSFRNNRRSEEHTSELQSQSNLV